MNILHLILNLLGVVLVAVTLPLTIELLVLSAAAAFPPRRSGKASAGSIRLAVVIPAHNEERLIVPCVQSLLADTTTACEIFVVAHNCSDRTAELAAKAGATVLPLQGPGGKGLALDHGFKTAVTRGVDAVLVIDADSVVSPNLLAEVANAIQQGAKAVQVRYQVGNTTTNFRTRLVALAFIGMNVLRPRGRWRLGLSCGIFGNGFALTAEALRQVPYTANSLVEDLEYHLRLIAAGIKVEFVNSAAVFGEMPEKSAAASTQRARWEGGRALMRREWTPRLAASVLRGSLRSIEPLLDVLALPLARQVVLILVAGLLQQRWLLWYSLVGWLAVFLYLAVSVALSPRPVEAMRSLTGAPFFILWKIMLIPRTRLAARKDAAWVRTDRNADTVATTPEP